MTDDRVERIAALALRKIGEAGSAAPAGALRSSPAESSLVATPEAPRRFSRMHRIAAVVSSFRPKELREHDPDSPHFDALLSDSTPAEEAPAPDRWTLLPHARSAVLSHFAGAREIIEAIEGARGVAEENDALLRGLELLSDAVSPSLEKLEMPSLIALSPLMPSLQRLLPHAPSRAEMERRIELLRLLQPFERLVGDHFAGRATELQQLSDYVGVLPPGSRLQALSRLVFIRKDPLLIWGVGGVGKSTLVAKFILDHAKLPEAERFPFAYLDFDRPALLVNEPATILVEAVRQIGLQYPVAYEATERLHAQWTELLQRAPGRAARSTKTSPGTSTIKTKKAVQRPASNPRERVLKDFVQFLSTLEVIRGPLLLVLDTFEEVQHRSSVYVRELLKFLDDLGRAVPRLRTVLSGRAPVLKLTLDTTIELKDFDDEAAIGFLMQKEQGVADSAIARTIVRQVGGNPLTLRLAAAVAAEEGVTADGIRSLETHGAFGLIRVKKSHLQGQLFRRILDHIHDDDVVKIAHPGLVLRRVTPDLIWKVLAGPCGVDVPTKEHAQQLFNKLKKEVSLVSIAGSGILEHRADVRRLMLGPLRETKPRETREIDELAAAYYAEQPGVTARAEEIYHRLVLGESHDEIEGLFLEGAENYLGGALDELAAPEKAFLAERLGVELPEDAWAGATQQVWERTAIRKIEEALEVRDLQTALAVLSERRERSAQTTLRVHEVIALTAAKKFSEAAAAVTAAVDAYASEGNLLGVFETQLAAAELSRAQADSEGALARLRDAEDIARATENDVHHLRVLVARALTLEGTEADLHATQEAIVECAARVGDDACRDDEVLIRLAGALAGNGPLMARAIRLTGLPTLNNRQRETLRSHFPTSPFDEERLAAFIENPPEDAKEFVLQTASDILRNDTDADASGRTSSGSSIRIAVPPDEETIREITSLDLSREQLERILSSLDQTLDSISFEKDVRTTMLNVIKVASAQGWMPQLIHALTRNAPSQSFLAFADRLGIGLTVDHLRGDSLAPKDLDALVWSRRTELAAIEARMCRVERGDRVYGTGFLIAPNLVLTSEGVATLGHVNATQVRFDVGEKDGQVFAQGTPARVTRMTVLGDSGDPRAAVLHLDRPVAFEPARGDASGRPRGSFEIRQPPDTLLADQPIVWLWHERGLRIGGSAQVIHASSTEIGFPVRPRDTFQGAPCFDLDLQLVAVHCGAHRRLKRECIARPIGMIAEELSTLKVP